MITAYMAVFVDGKQIDTMYPAQVGLPQARSRSRRPKSRSAGRSAEDLYAVLGWLRLGDADGDAADASSIRWSNWIWLGFGDHGARHRHRAAAGARRSRSRWRRSHAEAAATTAAVLLLALTLFGVAHAVGAGGMGGDADTRTSFYAR